MPNYKELNGYDKLNFIDKIRFRYRIRQAEKAESIRQSLEGDDYLGVDEQGILNQLIAEKENKKNNVKALNSGDKSRDYDSEKIIIPPFNKRYNVDLNTVKIPEPQIGTIEYALDQYLKATTFRVQEKGTYDPYNTLINLAAMSSKKEGNNPKIEANLVHSLENRSNMSNDFYLKRQNKSSGQTAFYHVMKNTKGELNKRIYLNCEKENIAQLAGGLIQSFEDMESYYLKFSSNMQAQNVDRSESIVIYVKDDEQLKNIISRVEKTRIQNPELFKGSENINPFMKNYNGYIAVANEPKSQKIQTIDKDGNKRIVRKAEYKMLNGQNKYCESSYNSVMSTALEDSMVNGINSLLKENADFRNKIKKLNLSKDCKDNPQAYALAILPEAMADDRTRMELISAMKNNLKEISQKNPDLDIQGIPNAKEQQIALEGSQK